MWSFQPVTDIFRFINPSREAVLLCYSFSRKNSSAFAVVASQTVEKDTLIVSANFLATSMQSAGSLDLRPFLKLMAAFAKGPMSKINSDVNYNLIHDSCCLKRSYSVDNIRSKKQR